MPSAAPPTRFATPPDQINDAASKVVISRWVHDIKMDRLADEGLSRLLRAELTKARAELAQTKAREARLWAYLAAARVRSDEAELELADALGRITQLESRLAARQRKAKHGWARRGEAWQGKAGPGRAGRGKARRGEAGLGWGMGGWHTSGFESPAPTQGKARLG